MQETVLNGLVINKMTKTKYNSITPSSTELYMIVDDNGLQGEKGISITDITSGNLIISKIGHSLNAITAKSAYGSTVTTAAANGGTIKVTDVLYDTYGHITASTDRTITLSLTLNTAGSTDTSSKIFLIGATSLAANPQTYSDNEVYVTSGVLTAKTFSGSGASLTNLDATLLTGTINSARLPTLYAGTTAITSAASYKTTPEVATIKINGDTSASAASTKNCTLQYDSTLQTLKFVFV